MRTGLQQTDRQIKFYEESLTVERPPKAVLWAHRHGDGQTYKWGHIWGHLGFGELLD